MKKALAMKCTQEQWDSIKGSIPEDRIYSVTSFEKYPWIFVDKTKQISNIKEGEYWKETWKRVKVAHETFNAKIFLDACGIDCEPKYSITKLQLTQLLKNNEEGNEQLVSADLRAWFPDAFKKELEAGKWYKSSCSVFFVTKIENEKVYAYGVNDGNWLQDGCFDIKFSKNDTEATPQEVESALILEWKRLGGKIGVVVNSPQKIWSRNLKLNLGLDEKEFVYRNNELLHCGVQVFYKGKFATIIQPEKMTLEQIEKELGRKIEIV